MSEEQMRKRCPSARKLCVAYLPGHKLVFNRKGSYRDGGVASISPSADNADRVYGVVWVLNDEDLQVLDKIEDPEAYTRENIRVVAIDDTEIDCHTYVAIPQAEYVVPDREYLHIVLSAARDQGFPAEYVNTIATFQRNQHP